MFGFWHLLDFFVGRLPFTIVNMYFSTILNASSLLSVHRFHECLDFCIFWICLRVSGHSHPKLVSSSSSEFVSSCLVFTGFINGLISSSSGCVCGSVAIAIVNLFWFPVLNLLCCRF